MSTLKVNTIQNTSAAHSSTPEQIAQGRAKAWCRMTNSGGTPAIADSFNVSSITDHTAGDFGFNFATNLANANYAAVATSEVASSNISVAQLVIGGNRVSDVRFQFFQIQTLSGGGNTVDPPVVAMICCGD